MKRKRLAVLLNQLEGRYQSSIWRGVAEVAEAAGADLFLFPGKSPGSTDPDEVRHTILYKFVEPELFDGFVMASGVLSNYIGPAGFLEFCRPFRGKPMVSISLEVPGVPSVMIDNASGMRALAGHCIGYHGYRRIAFVRGPVTNMEAELRFAAFTEVLAEHDLEADPELMAQGDFTRASGEAAIRQLWERGKRPEVVVFANDDMAYAAYAWARKQGIRIPEDIAMVGFDDIEEMRFLPAPFTTVSQPSHEQAALACRYLLRLLDGETIPLVTRLPTRLVIRQSCGCDREQPLPLPDIEPAPRQSSLFKEEAVIAAEQFILPILQQLEVPDGLGQRFREDARRLLLSLGQDCEEGTSSSRFEMALEEILSGCPEQDMFLDYLSQLFRMLRSEVLDGHGNPVTRVQFEMVLQRVMLLGRGHTIWREAGRRLRLEYLSWYLRGVNQRLSLSMEPERLYPMIAGELQALGIASAALSVYVRDTLGEGTGVLPELRLSCAYGPGGLHSDCGTVYPSRQLLPEGLLAGPDRRSLIVMPLFSGELQLGILVMEAGGIEDTLYETLRVTISDALVIAILFQEHRAQAAQLSAANQELETLNRRLHELSQRDELTGLYNRRGFMALAEHEFRTARRRGVPLVVFFIDLDGLKWINDELGHEQGDAAISGAAEVLRMSFRETDILARLGGDEFVVLASGADAVFGEEARERLYAEIAAWNSREARPFSLAMSMGIAVHGPDEAGDLDELLAAADALLYRDKEERERLGLRRGRLGLQQGQEKKTGKTP